MPALSPGVAHDRSFHVPEARVMALGTLTQGAEFEAHIADLAGDILRVEVTRVASGSSQYAITLNNWYHSLPHEPAGLEPRKGNGAPAHHPRYKYNDFATLSFGNRLRVDMRYWPDPEVDLDDVNGVLKAWVPMIAGPITDMSFAFSAGDGARVTIHGEDDLRPLKDKTLERESFTGTELEIIDKILNKAKYPLERAAVSENVPSFMRDPAKRYRDSVEANQSYYDFLNKLADRFDFELFVDFASLEDPTAGVNLHFEPSRSRIPPTKKRPLEHVYKLHRDRELIDFSPALNVADQFTEVQVRGRHRIRTRAKPVTGKGLSAILAPELHHDPSVGDRVLVAAPVARKKLFGDNPFVDDNHPNIDEERARARAEAILRRKARGFLRIDATTMGLPYLRPGRYVEIRGYREPFDGFYYVDKTVHTWGADGFRTKFSARRPGMPLPPHLEGSA